jgi:hypothetical protein
VGDDTMKAIHEYELHAGPVNSYLPIKIPKITKLKLPRNSQVLSILAERDAVDFSIKAYVEENGDEDHVTKIIALVTTSMPDDDVGWRFLNSLVVSVGPEDHPENTPYHAYVKIC